jgi:hypothetical protein
LDLVLKTLLSGASVQMLQGMLCLINTREIVTGSTSGEFRISAPRKCPRATEGLGSLPSPLDLRHC